MSFDQEPDPLSDALEHCQRLVKERDALAASIETLKLKLDVQTGKADHFQQRWLTTGAERDALLAFKAFVHKRYDQMGVPKEFPNGKHSKEGCRIGDRIDWQEAEVARLREELRPKSAAEEHNAMLHRTGQHPLPAPPGQPPVDDVNRCAVCGWPMAASVKGGCMRGNCSMRPLPERWYNPERATREGYHPPPGRETT